MSQMPEERAKHVDATANRLRLLQEDFADESPDLRNQQLCEEIERALAKIVPAEREAFLRDLQARFPAWEATVNFTPRNTASVPESAVAEHDLNDIAFLVSRLIEVSKGLPESERRVLVRRLHDAGLSMPGGQSWTDQQLDDFWSRLKMQPEAGIDTARLLDLAGLLIEFASKLDQVAWQSWKKISRTSPLRRSGDLHRTLAQFVSGHQDVPRGQVTQELEHLRMLTAALVTAIVKAGAQFAQEHAARFSPAEIEAVAEMDRNRWTSLETACWRKYKEIAAGADAPAIEKEIQQTIAELAEAVMRARPMQQPPNRVSQ